VPRGRGSDRPLIVELVPEDDEDGAFPAPRAVPWPDGEEPPSDRAGGPPGRAARLGAWLARQPRTRLVVAGVAVLALVAGVGVATTLADQRRVERLRAVPGGVVDLAAPPRTTWTFAAHGSVWPVAQLGALLVVAEQDDGDPSLFAPGPPAAGEVTLRALDPATGEARWSREVGTATACSGGSLGAFGPVDGSGPADRLACLVPSDGGWSVVVVDAGGDVVAERPLPGVDGPVGLTGDDAAPADAVATPTGDGLLRLERVGEPPTMPQLVDDGAGAWRVDGPVPARDLRVTLEDVVTGRERWATTLPAAPAVDWSSCATWPEGEPRLVSDANLWASAGGGLVSVQGCGVTAQLTTAGVRLDAGAPRAESVVPTAGGYAVPPPAEVLEDGSLMADTSTSWSLVRRDGTPVGELPGPLVAPGVTDGGETGLLFARDGGALVALRADDLTRAWQAGPGTGDGVVAQVDGTVLTLARGDLVGLDVATGRQRWATDVDTTTQEALMSGGFGLGTTFTDGRRVVVQVPGWSTEDGTGRWTAYDVRSGEVAWSQPVDGDLQSWTTAVDGHLLRGGTDRLEGLG
jgi:hypothetical protein